MQEAGKVRFVGPSIPVECNYLAGGRTITLDEAAVGQGELYAVAVHRLRFTDAHYFHIGSMAKPYQVRQVRNVIVRYKLTEGRE